MIGIGEARPSQIITSFGPGAIVDLKDTSVLVAAIDEWPERGEEIREPRLERATNARHFFAPPPGHGDPFRRTGSIKTYLFPACQFCPSCNTISVPSEGMGQIRVFYEKGQVRCNAAGCLRHPQTLPAPFIVGCPDGHLDEFPWRWYVHGGDSNCRQTLRLITIGKSGMVGDLIVQCGCGKSRPMSEAFGKPSALSHCSGRRPWFGPEDRETCTHADQLKAIQRGATNAWFGIVKSVLKLGDGESEVDRDLGKCDQVLLGNVRDRETLDFFISKGMLHPVDQYSIDSLWDAIQRQRNGYTNLNDMELRRPEWEALIGEIGVDRPGLELEETAIPSVLAGHVCRVLLVHRLTEVRALTGFTRIEEPSEADTVRNMPIRREGTDWLPAVEVGGEGIFIQFDDGMLLEWERRPEVVDRTAAMRQRALAWARERNATTPRFPGARYIFMHSFAHLLIRQLSLECGYSASSIRERIYSDDCADGSRQRMAGVLLYTASTDSDGSLGGLVDQGRPKRFPAVARQALHAARVCSSDPLCSDHTPEMHSSINGSACHACLFVAETSCEQFNQYLDRGFVAPTLAEGDMSFFKNP